MPIANRLVFFDFCETLISFQTADCYVDFCRERVHKFRMQLLQFVTEVLTYLQFFKIMNRFIPNNTIRKRLILYQLKGLSYWELDRLAKVYYEECLSPSIIPEIQERLLKHIELGDSVWIVSGGYDIYIKYFVADFHLAGYVSTKIAFSKEGICRGTFDGIDCMRENKVYLLKQCLGSVLSNEEIKTLAYSDSSSDLPLLLMVSEGYVVSKGKTQEWSKQNSLKELIWE